MPVPERAESGLKLPTAEELEACARTHPAIQLGRDVTIGVAAHGNHQTTRKCLEAILASAKGEFQLVLVDDFSRDDGALLSLYREAKNRHTNTEIYKTEDRNLEYSGSLNLVLSHAKGEVVLFVSNDIYITPYYLSAILSAARSLDRVGTIRGSSNFVDNGLPSHNILSQAQMSSLTDVFEASCAVHQLYGVADFDDAYLTGDAFAVSRALIEKIGTFDPMFYGYFADHDYGLRAQIAGFRTLLVPGAYAYHERGGNFSALPEEQFQLWARRRWTRVYENWARFKLKYDLPVDLEYVSVNTIAWDELAAVPFSASRHFSAPMQYSSYRQP